MAKIQGLNASQTKQLQIIDDDLKEIQRVGDSPQSKTKVNKDMDALQNILEELENSDNPDTVANVKEGLQQCLHVLKGAIGSTEETPLDMGKIEDAEQGIKGALGGMEEEE